MLSHSELIKIAESFLKRNKTRWEVSYFNEKEARSLDYFSDIRGTHERNKLRIDNSLGRNYIRMIESMELAVDLIYTFPEILEVTERAAYAFGGISKAKGNFKSFLKSKELNFYLSYFGVKYYVFFTFITLSKAIYLCLRYISKEGFELSKLETVNSMLFRESVNSSVPLIGETERAMNTRKDKGESVLLNRNRSDEPAMPKQTLGIAKEYNSFEKSKELYKELKKVNTAYSKLCFYSNNVRMYNKLCSTLALIYRFADKLEAATYENCEEYRKCLSEKDSINDKISAIRNRIAEIDSDSEDEYFDASSDNIEYGYT